MSAVDRHHVRLAGNELGQPIVFAHGFGCDQRMWRKVAPAFEDEYRVVLFDHVGSGRSDLRAYDPTRYATLHGYASDVIELCEDLGLEDIVFVGHSVSAMIGVLAAIERPDLFDALVLVGPSPRYLDDDGYRGGFAPDDIDDLLGSLESNYLGWSRAMAPAIMGNADRPELGDELSASFCANDPEIAKHFARVTFLSDNRGDLPRCTTRSLVMQMTDDVIAPVEVGEYMHRALRDSELVVMSATGHCPNLSAPDETISTIKSFLVRARARQ